MKYIFLLFLFQLSFSCFGQDSLTHSEPKLYLITCDPGDEIYSNFGHSAIRWVDPSQKVDLVFNYGTFDFRTPGFYPKFLRGKLPYHLSVAPYGAFLEEYYQEKRSVYEQELLLPQENINAAIQFLKINAQPENRQYKYDFFFDNCSSRIRDVFDQAVDHQMQYNQKESNVSYRDLLHEYLVGKPWIRLGIDLIIGSKADQVADISHQMFLPDRLMSNLSSVTIEGKPILSEPYQVLLYEEEKINRKQAGIFGPRLVFLFLLFLALVLRKYHFKSFNIFKKVFYALAGLGGLLIIFLWFGTDHLATKMNYNLLWLSPLFLLLLFPIKRKKPFAIFLLAMIALALVLTSFTSLQCMFFIEIFVLLAFLLITDIWPNYFFESGN